MKICVVIDNWFPNIGGGPVHVYELARRLQDYPGVEIEVITSKLKMDLTSNQEWWPKESKLRIIRLGREGQVSNILNRVFFLIVLFFFLVTRDFDLLHIHPYSPLLIAKIIGLIRHKPVVVTVHVVGVEALGMIFHSLWQKIDRFFTYGIAYDAQIYVDETWLGRSRSQTQKKVYIPNGVDVLPFQQFKVVKNYRFQFLFVGRFHPQKNLENLVRAFSIFIKQRGVRDKVRLTLVGDGPERGKLARLKEKLHISDSVAIAGVYRGRQLWQIYKESSAFILPSRYEGFPLTLLEAWAAKLPVGVTAVGQMKKIVKHGVNGFVAKDSSLRSLVKLMETIYKSKGRKEIALNAYKTVRNSYSWELAALKTHKLYLEVIKSNKSNG